MRSFPCSPLKLPSARQRILTHAQPERNPEKNKIEKRSKVQNRSIFEQSKKWSTKAVLNRNRPVSYFNGWTGSSMKWRLMQAN